MDDKTETQPVQGSSQTTQKVNEDRLNEAAQRVYDQYGPNLPAFFRDIQRELTKRQG